MEQVDALLKSAVRQMARSSHLPGPLLACSRTANTYQFEWVFENSGSRGPQDFGKEDL